MMILPETLSLRRVGFAWRGSTMQDCASSQAQVRPELSATIRARPSTIINLIRKQRVHRYPKVSLSPMAASH
jgi:hypothetical protein